jgi:phage terminase large subunit-like protein
MLPHTEALYGGAAGSGKSAVLLMDALRYTSVPEYAAIIFRRSLTDLKRHGGLLDMAYQWLGPYLGREMIYEPSTHMFKWANGASLTFGYVGSYSAWEHYQGGNYQFIGWDELTQHAEQDYGEMFSRLRRNSCSIHADFPQESCNVCHIYQHLRKVPLRVRSTTNPGGRGHIWVKKRFKLFKQKNSKVINPVTKKNEIWLGGDPSKPYIPGFFTDNPGLDQETYKKNLQMIGDAQREAQLLEGDWDWIASGVFKPEWFMGRWGYRNGYYAILSPTTGIATHSFHEKRLRIYTVIDVACSVREGVGERSFKQSQGADLPPSWTVIGTFGITPKNELLILDIKRFQEEAPQILDGVKETCVKWHPDFVAIEVNGPGKPIAQLLFQMGVPIKEVLMYNDKPSNSAEAQVRCRSGKVLLPEEGSASWVDDFLGELTVWTGHPHEPNDQVDVLSNAVHEFTRIAGNQDRDGTILQHSRNLPHVCAKHGRVFDYPNLGSLM